MTKNTLAFIVAIFAVLLGYYLKTQMDRKRKIIGHEITYQRNTLNHISRELQFLAIDYGLYKRLDELLDKIEDEDLKLALISKGYDPGDQIFHDRWGTPIELKIVSSNEYHLISAGPNKKYENGNGDDIVLVYNPLEEIEKRNKLIKQYQVDDNDR